MSIGLVLAGCAGGEARPPARTGTVLNVYSNPAPGLFIESRLAGAAIGSPRWIQVDLHPTRDATAQLATARLAPGIKVESGDMVRVRLKSQDSHRLQIPISPDHVVEALGTDEHAIASLLKRH